MSNLTLSVESRELQGKGASRRLRRLEQKVPAILYGAGKDPVMLSIPSNRIKKALENEAFFSQVIELDIDGKKEKAVLRDIQRHPAKEHVMHMDFLRITGKETITMKVPLHFLNQDKSPGVKAGGVVSHIITELEIKCLPKDLPEFIAIDLGKQAIDTSVHLTDVVLPEGVELAIGEIEEGHDSAVVSIQKPKRAAVEEESDTDSAAASDGEDKPASDSE